MKTTTFTATHIHDNDTLFLGNAKGKHDSFVAVTEMLCNEFPETPLVVKPRRPWKWFDLLISLKILPFD